ncbi:MAG: thiol-disulfide oxidoreductase DCC family protein [Parafilimonas sp.]|nr:thiol-disulfide oxidoreductase DCC family protein [Parafilimonas sp.]
MAAVYDHPVILFDGVCNLCNSGVQFVIRHDPEHIFRFASLQSTYGQQILSKYDLPLNNYNSFILLTNHKIYTRSSAALMVAKQLQGFIKLLYIFIAAPKFIRDGIYNIIAKNRYKWFGKKNECWIPTPELKSLFFE